MNTRRYVYTWSTMFGMQRTNQYDLLCSISVMEERQRRAEVRSESDAADGYRLTKTQLYSDALPHRFDICLSPLSLIGTQAMTSAEGTKRKTRKERLRQRAVCTNEKTRDGGGARGGYASVQPRKERTRTLLERDNATTMARAPLAATVAKKRRLRR